jgi:hypothetical protein
MGLDWNVTFNPSKCEQIIISNKVSNSFPQIVFEDAAIPISNSVKLLGVTIDSSLNWSSHIECQSRKAAQMLGCLARARHLIPAHHMVTLYKAKIRPVLEYCSTVWGSACDTNLKLLDQVEKRAARIIGPSFNVPYDLGTRRTVGGLAFVHKLLQGRGSNELQALLPGFVPRSCYLLRSSTKNHKFTFQIPFCRTEQRKRSFMIKYSEIWNTLPDALANPLIKPSAFKKQVSLKPP